MSKQLTMEKPTFTQALMLTATCVKLISTRQLCHTIFWGGDIFSLILSVQPQTLLVQIQGVYLCSLLDFQWTEILSRLSYPC